MKNTTFFFLILFLTSCGSDESQILEIEKKLTILKINSTSGNRLDVFSMENTTLTVSGLDQENDPFPISAITTWSASNGNANVNQEGMVTAVEVGPVIITATVENVSAVFEMIVYDSSAPVLEVYISDAGNFQSPPWQIIKVDQFGENPVVFTTQNLGWPQDILFLEDQDQVLISNLNTGNVGRYDISNGNFISNFATGLNGPTRMKIGPDGYLYVLQWGGDGFVHRYELDGTPLGTFTSVGVFQSIGLDWDSSGNLYISSFNDGNGGSVRKFDQNGDDMGLFINANLQGPTNIWFKGTELWVNDWQEGSIKRFSSIGSIQETTATGLSQPEGIGFFEDGSFLVGNSSSNIGSVKKFNSAGSFEFDFISTGIANLIAPNAVAIRAVPE